MLIREYDDKDYEELKNIVAEVFKKGDTYPYDPEMPEDEMMKIWLDGKHKIYVAIIEEAQNSEKCEAIVGSYYIKANQPSQGAHICNCGFIVSVEYGGLGFGSLMGEHALLTAKKLQYLAMQFNLVLENNIASIKIWEKLGFKTIGMIPKAFKHPDLGLVDARIMYKSL